MTKSNPDLRPESNRTGELVVEQYVGRHVRAAATAFHYTIDDLITQTTDAADGLLVYNNVERITARGIEVDRAGVSVRPAARLGRRHQDGGGRRGPADGDPGVRTRPSSSGHRGPYSARSAIVGFTRVAARAGM